MYKYSNAAFYMHVLTHVNKKKQERHRLANTYFTD